MFGVTDYKMWRFSIHRSVRCFYGADKRNHYFFICITWIFVNKNTNITKQKKCIWWPLTFAAVFCNYWCTREAETRRAARSDCGGGEVVVGGSERWQTMEAGGRRWRLWWRSEDEPGRGRWVGGASFETGAEHGGGRGVNEGHVDPLRAILWTDNLGEAFGPRLAQQLTCNSENIKDALIQETDFLCRGSRTFPKHHRETITRTESRMLWF